MLNFYESSNETLLGCGINEDGVFFDPASEFYLALVVSLTCTATKKSAGSFCMAYLISLVGSLLIALVYSGFFARQYSRLKITKVFSIYSNDRIQIICLSVPLSISFFGSFSLFTF